MEKNNMGQNNASLNNNPKKPIYKKSRFIVIVAIFAFGIICSACGNETKNNNDSAEANIDSSIDAETEKPTVVSTESLTEISTEKAKDINENNKKDNEDAVKELEIKSPDEFIYDGNLYSINNLTIDEVKKIFSSITEMGEFEKGESLAKNDDLVFMFDSSGNINAVYLLNNKGSFLKNINTEMSGGDIENIIGSSADDEGELWFLDSRGNATNDIDAPYFIQLLEDEDMGTVLMLCRTDTAMEAEGANGISQLFIGYEPNDILPDWGNVAVYLDDTKVFNLQQGDVNVLLYNNDGKKHTLRIETSLIHTGTSEIEFRSLEANTFCISGDTDGGYSISKNEPYEFNIIFQNTDITEDNIYILENNKVLSYEKYIENYLNDEIESAYIDGIMDIFN